MSDFASGEEKTSKEVSFSIGSGESKAEFSGIDMSLLEDSLSKTPWERMLANDDALNFAESLRSAMLQHNAKS
ncbi:MAG: hypothetical protein H0X66_06720 [Verrucomicrobia bacterium]|nr:hypothetical protein [Verrucomicrobiota bacterium]